MDDFRRIQTQTGWGRVLADFAAWCAPQAGWSTLDVGCGPGLFPALLARQGASAYGVDLEAGMFTQPLHPVVAVADARSLPFPDQMFDLVTASNLLFLIPEPVQALCEMARVLREGKFVALLNPSERLTVDLAAAFAEQRGLDGLARRSLVSWAKRAEAGQRWSQTELIDLFQRAGLKLVESSVKVGPGLARFALGVRDS